MRTNRIAIIGGGPGGLMTAYYLEKWANSPFEITIFEASPRLGGKIVTPRFKTVPVQYEAGAAEFYDYELFGEDPLKELIRELGLSISPMGGSSVIMNEEILSNLEDVKKHLGSEIADELAAFDLLAKNYQIPQEFYHSDHPEGFLSVKNAPAFDTFLNKLSQPSRLFIETLIHSDLATEPHRTNISYGLQNYLMNDSHYMHLYGIQGGNEQLPKELAARIGAKIELERLVTHLGKLGSQYRVRSIHHGEVRFDDFDIVVIALPHNQVVSVEFEGEKLSSAMQKHHAHYNYPAHYLRMTLLFETPFWRTSLTDSYWMLDQFGGCCLYDESLRQPGISHGILGWLLSGQIADEMCDWDDERLVQAALDSLPKFLANGKEQFIEGRVQRWPNAVNGMPGGADLWRLDHRHQPEPVVHPDLFIVGDYLYDSTLNGVVDSAVYVSEWIAARMIQGNSPDRHPRREEHLRIPELRISETLILQ